MNSRPYLHQAVRLSVAAAEPPARHSPSAKSRAKIPTFAVPKLRILLVEDNSVNRLVATRMLSRLGQVPDVCHDGFEAVERATAYFYDIILMDVHMPKMDGLEATNRIRALQRSDRIPRIVAVTANTSDESRDACRAAGMDGFLAKPLTLDKLASTLIEFFEPPT